MDINLKGFSKKPVTEGTYCRVPSVGNVYSSHSHGTEGMVAAGAGGAGAGSGSRAGYRRSGELRHNDARTADSIALHP